MTLPAFLHPFAPPAKASFRTVVRGKGALLYDDRGTEYVDGMASLWYMNVGYGRPEMVEAISRQAAELAAFHTFDPFTNRPADRLADLIASLAPMPEPRVFFTNSGSEAVDTAMKLARLAQLRAGHPERTLVVGRPHAYHGTNYGGTSAQGITANREGWGPLVGDVVIAPGSDLEAMTRVFAERGSEVAAVLAEPVQGAGGVYPPPEGYLEGLRRLCDRHGALLILDEVICGFGRLGAWFGSQRYGVVPDLVTFAKAVTSGYVPMGGVIVGRAVREPLESDPSFVLRHGYTYSGHPLAAAAGLAALAIQEREGLVERATHVGRRLAAGLRSLHADGLVADVRGEGAVWGLQLHGHQSGPDVRDRALAEGVIVRPIFDTIALCPPLVIEDGQVDRIVDALAVALA
jgi:adenosylmethionine-8-amino-7-oxononanoate aminotransferase